MRDRNPATASARRALASGQARMVLFGAAVAALFAGVGLLHTSVRIDVVREGYELGKVERTYRDLLREREHLRMERATLRSAPRLEAFAKARLGMAPPSASQMVPLAVRGSSRPDGRAVAAAGLAHRTPDR